MQTLSSCVSPAEGISPEKRGFGSQETVNSWSWRLQDRWAALAGAESWEQRGTLIEKVSLVSAGPGLNPRFPVGFSSYFWTKFHCLWNRDWPPRWLSGKESACQCRSRGFDPRVGKVPWRRNGNPLQDSCLEDPMEPGRLQSMGSQRVGHDWARTGI